MFCACGKHYFSLKFLLKHFFACLFEKVAEKLHAAKKEDWNGRRKGIVRPELLSKEERAELIRRNPSYGTIICRCENVTKAEVLQALRNPLGVCTVTGVKARCRTMMGRCQGGYCQTRVAELIMQEKGLPPEEVLYSVDGSYLFTGAMGKGDE